MAAMSLHQRKSSPAGTASPRAVVELVLSGDLDMQDAEELERFLTGSLERGCDVLIDLAEVRLIDCVCVGVGAPDDAGRLLDFMNEMIKAWTCWCEPPERPTRWTPRSTWLPHQSWWH